MESMLRGVPPMQMLGRSEAVRALDADISRAARTDAKVLITGETGVGKEVAGRLIHARSARARNRLVTLNCAGLPDSLLESELFGHVRGSFTGAYRDKPGLLEMASHGTIFMDEVGEMSTRMQVVLLRFLETSEIQRVGSEAAHTRVDVRIVAATNRDLRAQISAGAFREDLFFRLNVIRLDIPPLRERPEDIPVLVDHYVTMFSERHAAARPEISTPAMAKLTSYPWPGNIRELKNVVERLVLATDAGTADVKDLPADIFGSSPVHRFAAPAAPESNEAAETCIQRMTAYGESFWSAVYPSFMARNLTCDDMRVVVTYGLEHTNGNYRSVVRLFNMPPDDYKRFLRFLRKHRCNVPFQPFREGLGRAGLKEPLRTAKPALASASLRERSCA